MRKGIDVSSYQGKIDWEKVKSEIDFAIIRCGWGNDDVRQDDIYYERNSNLCEELGIPYGVYLYSYATNLDEARSEVLHTLRLIKDKKLEYPVFLDVESKRQMALPKEKLTEVVNYYCDTMEKEGYYVGIYSSLDRFNSNLSSPVLDAYDKWVAEWNERFTFKGKAGMWQNTSHEDLNGISGRVDGDIAFYDYPKIIRDNHLNHLDDDTYKYKVGDTVYVSGNIYSNSGASEISEKVCDAKLTIEEIVDGAQAPYKTIKGYVEESSIFLKTSINTNIISKLINGGKNMKDEKNEVDVLDELNKGACMGRDAIHFILDKVKDKKLKEELNIQYNKYKEISDKICELYPEYSEKEPHETNGMNKAMTWMGIEMNTMMDKSTSKIAELLLQGTNMGIIEGRKLLNNNNTDKEINKLVEEYVDMQEDAVENLKKFL